MGRQSRAANAQTGLLTQHAEIDPAENGYDRLETDVHLNGLERSLIIEESILSI